MSFHSSVLNVIMIHEGKGNILIKVPNPAPLEAYLPPSSPPPGHGRPTLSFEESSPKTQQHKSAQLAKEKVLSELLQATEKRAHSDGDNDLAYVVKKMRVERCALLGDG